MTKTASPHDEWPMNEERSNIGAEFIESVIKSDLVDIAADLSEIALDSLLENGVARDIPIVGWLFKIHSAQRSLRDRLFLKKVAAFYRGASKALSDERATFRKKLKADKAYQKRVGEDVLLLIERHERFEKSLLLRKLFAGLIGGHLSHDIFMRLAAILDKAVIEDLEGLNLHRESTHELSEQETQGLYRCGLMDMKISVGGLSRELIQIGMTSGFEMNRDGDVTYELNDLGQIFIEYAFESSANK